MEHKDTFFSRKRTLNCNGKLIDLSTPKVMGILNVTPDSFYDGGKYYSDVSILEAINEMVDEGVDIVDIGGYSSRPGAIHISEQEELTRISKALTILRKQYPEIIVSIDTFRSSIAKTVVKEYNVNMINDISAGNMDENMPEMIASLQVPYIIMHMQGKPQDMQDNPKYKDIIPEILSYFSNKIFMLRERGIQDIIIDPGFGFGKLMEHNFKILQNLDQFAILDLPILVGLSRKSMIYKTLGNNPEDALNGTTVLNTIALLKGVDIVRVHDVKEAKECIKLLNKYESVV
ncbi:MAG: dihydropteroate synthase [Bacteroidales bacterium]|nr:dihydropteroate synthase [Bacteroidales bacterium]